MKIMILGASGMLGNAMFRLFAESTEFAVMGTLRSDRSKKNFSDSLHPFLLSGVDVDNFDTLVSAMNQVRPDIVINCVGLVKQLSQAEDPLSAIPVNSMLPHRLARLCAVAGARFIHMSTDCVFSGAKGMYVESDLPDADDLYGRSKLLGEVDYSNAITLRTSIIGHELEGARSLIGWFLSQNETVRGYSRAVFSGLPTVEIACLIRDYVLPNPHLHGVYHVSSDPINKYDLLSLVAKTYGKEIVIERDDGFAIDRSLDSSLFRAATGFKPKSWFELVKSMKRFG
jgi:dTDP-4-dehydrorhamnose reductase